MTILPLSGIRVLDLSRLLPGPYATLILADLGAQVVKVEDPAGGDYIRHFPPHVGETGALFAALNRGKQSVTLDLRQDPDRQRFLRLLETADVLVESFRPGVLGRLGLGRSLLQERFPNLVGCSITGYGPTGPLRERAGHDINYIALAGLLGISGQTPGQPAFPGGQVADIGGGSLLAVISILAALRARDGGGGGTWIDTRMTHGVLAFLTMHLSAWRAAGPGAPIPGAGGMQLNGAHCCYTVYSTSDGGWVALGALEPKFWENFCTAVGRDDLRGCGFDPARPGNPTYEATRDEFLARSREEWSALNDLHDFCCEPVLDFAEVHAHPMFADMFFELPSAGGPLPQVEVPLGLPGISGREAAPPPGLGEHNHLLDD